LRSPSVCYARWLPADTTSQPKVCLPVSLKRMGLLSQRRLGDALRVVSQAPPSDADTLTADSLCPRARTGPRKPLRKPLRAAG
jgi:hypothetical protein